MHFYVLSNYIDIIAPDPFLATIEAGYHSACSVYGTTKFDGAIERALNPAADLRSDFDKLCSETNDVFVAGYVLIFTC